MYQLNSQHIFPSALSANKEGVVAIGGDLSPERILIAYKNGIFPWFENDDFLAIVLQHEIDHLKGKLFIDYLSPLKQKMALKKVKKSAKAAA